MGAREWKDLKAKQKQKLSEVMFGVVCAHYKEHGNGLPEPPKPRVKKTEAEKLAIKRAARKRKKARLAAQEQQSLPEQDGRFFYIAGYTSGGAPYGVTWEEMGLEPWEELE